VLLERYHVLFYFIFLVWFELKVVRIEPATISSYMTNVEV